MNSLGDRMKSYESVTRSVMLPHSLTVLRVDGRAFHSYLRHARKPFDEDFIDDMMAVGVALCSEIGGATLAYGQSDEISLLLDDREPQAQPWFGGVVQKMVSVAASVATSELVAQRGVSGRPQFDARVFTLPSVAEAHNYLIWRQRDAVRNSISMAAQARFSHGQLRGVSGGQMQEMLWREHRVNWNDYPVVCKRGWVVVKTANVESVTYKDKRTSELATVEVERARWSPSPAPDFVFGEGFLAEVIS